MTSMKVISVAEVAGPALNWLVAKCEGYETAFTQAGDVTISREGVIDYFDPHRNWGWCGPIIERMFAQGLRLHTAEYMTGIHDKNIMVASLDSPNGFWFGPTPLIAAMRCYVASRLGKTVEVPEELLY